MHISSLTRFSPLFRDYVANFNGRPIQQFFPAPPTLGGPDLLRFTTELAELDRERNRATVASAIDQLHSSLGLRSSAISENIAALREPNTFAIVTGQQVGVLGGPLYSFYKAFTAIELAKRWSSEAPNMRFVPVFWLETEDHDLDEATPVHILDKDGAVATVRYAPTGANDAQNWRRQIGPMPIDADAIEQFFAQLASSLAPTEFTERLLNDLRSIYAAGTTFAHAFAQLLFRYFGEDGLLMIDANEHTLKSAATDLFLREVDTAPQLSEKIVLQSVKLEEYYHAQVKPRALNLFLIENGERLPIVEHEPSAQSQGRTFFVKGTRRTFTLAELTALISEQPEKISPNVVMRPLYQDTLLPTAAYIAGPGEVAYFAQFAPAYEWAGIRMPVIVPRLSATIVEERLERILEKYEITVEQVLEDGNALEERLMAAFVNEDLERALERSAAACETTLEELRAAIQGVDPTLDAALTTIKGKMATTVRDFGNKVLAADRKRHATARQQLDRLFAALLPEDELQERELSLIYFLNKYGPGFLDRIKTLLAPHVEDWTEHVILHITQPKSVVAGSDHMETRTSEAQQRLTAVPNSD